MGLKPEIPTLYLSKVASSSAGGLSYRVLAIAAFQRQSIITAGTDLLAPVGTISNM